MAVPQFHVEPLRFVRPGTLVDVGVNIGYHFEQFIRFPDCRIVGFEPQRILFNNLCNWLNEVFSGVEWPDYIELYNVALSNFVGRTLIRVPIVNGDMCHPGGSITKPFDVNQTLENEQVKLLTHWVQVTTLDAQKLDNVTYLKIDAEGAEQEIIEGAADTIARWKPIIDIELEEVHRAGCLQTVSNQLYAHGYIGYFICEEQLTNLTHFDPARHQVCEDSGIGATRRKDPYIFDFQFIHKDDVWGRNCLKEIYGNLP